MILEFLDDRKKRVLQIIIEDYVRTVEPVGSKTVTEKHHLEASPATIRFDMADLEKQGYIKKPHTSSGRIPSDKGYRFFIDNLMQIDSMSKREVDEITHQLVDLEKEDLLHMIGDLLSSLSGNTAVVVSSGKDQDVYVSGMSKMLRHPEFGFADMTCNIIETLEKHSVMMELLNSYAESLKSDDIAFRIGKENESNCFRECSVALTPFKKDGVISVIGPTRMKYEKVSSILRYFADLLEGYDL